MKLTLATPADAQQVLHLELVALSDQYHGYDSIDDIKDMIAKEEIYLVYLDHDTLIGHIICSKRDSYCYIEGLVIEEKYRSKALGRLAIKMLVAIKGDRDIKLVVHPRNIPAIITYLKNDFIITGYETNKFGDGEDRLVLIRRRGITH
jgi:ribosomal protein S18 acetylase RimI-like enzyme